MALGVMLLLALAAVRLRVSAGRVARSRPLNYLHLAPTGRLEEGVNVHRLIATVVLGRVDLDGRALRLQRFGQRRLQRGRDLGPVVVFGRPLRDVQAQQEDVLTLKL